MVDRSMPLSFSDSGRNRCLVAPRRNALFVAFVDLDKASVDNHVSMGQTFSSER